MSVKRRASERRSLLLSPSKYDGDLVLICLVVMAVLIGAGWR